MPRILALCLLALPWGHVHAQTYPAKPIRLIVPVSPGSSSNDILGRALAKNLSEALGQQLVVENQAGASGTIGTRTVARAAPDGYTLLLGYAGAQTIAPAVIADIGYDPVKDLAPVAMFSTIPYVMLVHPAVPATTVRELVAHARSHPGELTMASSGAGSSPHLAGVLFMQETGVKFLHVPYKAAASAHNDLVAGNVQVYFSGVTSVAPLVRTGKLRALLIANSNRSVVLPDVPSAPEAGIPGVVASGWNGILAPARIPDAIVNRLYDEIAKISNSQETKNFLIKQGAEPALLPPAKFGERIRSELEQWTRLIRTAHISIE